jgi:anti-anti-sigma regulatory factor
MLKITLHDAPFRECIQLEGKLSGAWVEELDRVWQSLTASLDSRELQIDLRGVSFVDQSGRNLLRQMHQKSGALFLADSPLTQYFADEATKKR